MSAQFFHGKTETNKQNMETYKIQLVIQTVEDYYACLDISRKLVLEEQLLAYKDADGMVDLAKLLITSSVSDMVKFFLLSVFEHRQLYSRTIWTDDEVVQNRGFLWMLVTGNGLKQGFYFNLIKVFPIILSRFFL